MRRSCLECVAKHLGSAAVYIEEVEMGYPNYYGFVYGELDHAASECMEMIPRLAMAIREHRINWASKRKERAGYRIPFEAMFDYIDAVMDAGDVMLIPDEVLDGIARDADGNHVFSQDTRPPSDGGKDDS